MEDGTDDEGNVGCASVKYQTMRSFGNEDDEGHSTGALEAFSCALLWLLGFERDWG